MEGGSFDRLRYQRIRRYRQRMAWLLEHGPMQTATFIRLIREKFPNAPTRDLRVAATREGITTIGELTYAERDVPLAVDMPERALPPQGEPPTP